MQFNIEKCHVMHLGFKNKGEKYSINGKELGITNEERDLGVQISSDFKVAKQCGKAAKKANKILGLIKRNIRCKTKNIIVRLYKALVRPHMEYCVQAWRPHLAKDINILERVQRRATKMIEGCRGKSYEERLKFTGLITLEQRRTRADMKEVSKILKGFEGLEANRFFTMQNMNLRGHALRLHKEGFRKDIVKYSFRNRVINTWNELPDKAVNSGTINSFKGHLDRFLSLKGGRES